MRFGLDVAQQRMPWDEVVGRVQFAEELGFDGAWGFDHFQPMYGDGPGETFEGMTTLAALAGVTSRIRLGLLVDRRDLPAPVGVRRPGHDHRPRLARPARALARRRVVRQGARRARHPVPLDAGAVRPARGRARDRHPPVHRRGRVLRRHGRVAARRAAPPAAGAAAAPADLDRRQRAHAAPSRSSPATPTSGTRGARPNSLRETNERVDELATEAGRDPASIMRASSLSLDDLDTARKHAGKWRDAGYGYLVCGWPDAGRAQIEAFAREVMPEFAD